MTDDRVLLNIQQRTERWVISFAFKLQLQQQQPKQKMMKKKKEKEKKTNSRKLLKETFISTIALMLLYVQQIVI